MPINVRIKASTGYMRLVSGVLMGTATEDYKNDYLFRDIFF
ncbi:hypothetical protein SC09_Contig19orf01337 [Bacillus subtilis]|uniref:Uncharacterized protein n=1 Tax=Bacillus subtilis TaxID=1423 RepID=A0A0D1KVK2_BACIU|nr:hypothetical protein SC09_Contig19orf01337 [Bacillus subtilis]